MFSFSLRRLAPLSIALLTACGTVSENVAPTAATRHANSSAGEFWLVPSPTQAGSVDFGWQLPDANPELLYRLELVKLPTQAGEQPAVYTLDPGVPGNQAQLYGSSGRVSVIKSYPAAVKGRFLPRLVGLNAAGQEVVSWESEAVTFEGASAEPLSAPVTVPEASQPYEGSFPITWQKADFPSDHVVISLQQHTPAATETNRSGAVSHAIQFAQAPSPVAEDNDGSATVTLPDYLPAGTYTVYVYDLNQPGIYAAGNVTVAH